MRFVPGVVGPLETPKLLLLIQMAYRNTRDMTGAD